ncbi:MAG TPA: TonB-dependent receptor [Flavobacteriaceae bacterium]|nr:TonB-dependent receptor [Flavobacteriaceae bacterium]
MSFSLKNGIAALFVLSSGLLYAQDNPLPTEHLIIIKPYSPTLSDASKMKQVPTIGDSLTSAKIEPEYSVVSVPVASTFVPEKGKAASVKTSPGEYLYDNYAVLGFGNYTRILGELYSNFQFNDYQNLSLFLIHNSTQGGIDGILLDDKYYDTKLGVNFSSNDRYYSWGLKLDAQHQLVNWYGAEGVLTSADANLIDPQQNYYGISLGGNIEYYEGLFDAAELTYRYFGDAYGSMENHLRIAPKLGVPVGDQTISLNLFADYVGGSFEQSFGSEAGIKYGNLNLGAHPSLLVNGDNFSVDLGAEVVYAMDMENEENEFFIYPKMEASYRIADGYFVPYAGVDGGLEQNTYYHFAQENPFVSPTLFIAPTSHIYSAYLGAKGKFTETVGYNFKASYGKDENKAFFMSNQFVFSATENYQHGNSFGVVYDDMNILGMHGELNATMNDKLQLRLNASYFNYETETLPEAWNLPEFKASLNGNYQITEKWSAGANFFFVGERKELEVMRDGIVAPSILTLDSYFDMNLHVGYQFNDQLSAFVKGNNLLGENYERWNNFPVLGTQVMGGVTYKFDW